MADLPLPNDPFNGNFHSDQWKNIARHKHLRAGDNPSDWLGALQYPDFLSRFWNYASILVVKTKHLSAADRFFCFIFGRVQAKRSWMIGVPQQVQQE